MTENLQRFRLLATFIAGRSVDIARAAPGQLSYTDGDVIYVSASDPDIQRREVVLQGALLGARSLDPSTVRLLRGRPSVARRYLALEGRRVLAELAHHLPLAADLGMAATTSSALDSLEIARGRTPVDAAPDWFGVIEPSRLSAEPKRPGSRPTKQDLQLRFDAAECENEDTEDRPAEESKILKLFDAPIGSRVLSHFLSRLFGTSRSEGDDAAGSELQIGRIRRTHRSGPEARPLPTPIGFTAESPAADIGIGGCLQPEWDVHRDRYRPDWCRVIDFPLTTDADVSAAHVRHDEVLRRRLARVGLGPKVLRARADGDELDIEALIDLFVDLRTGHSAPEHVYTERRMLARDLGVLILLDASGSATDTDADGLSVHDHQRRAAATLALTLEELGDRAAVYAFRSQGRHSVHLPAIKTFGQPFGAVGRARLNGLQPYGYTRLGAAIRGAGEIIKHVAGTPNRLLVVLSDGFPYDHGYEGAYAEADSRKALEELRADGVACLCLSIGAATRVDALERVFGSAGFARAAALADLSPRMDELFLSALRELSAPRL